MPTYYYTAKRQNGTDISGTVEAVSPKEAVKALSSQKLLMTSISDKDPALTDSGKNLSFKERVSFHLPLMRKDMIFFYRQMAMMLRSGLTVTRALRLLMIENPKRVLKTALQEIVADVQAGMAFSEALRKHPNVFKPVDVNIIASAELSGEMHSCLDKIADHLSFWGEVKAKVIQSMIYPAIVLLFVIFVGLVIVFKIIPTFEKYLLKNGNSLPFLTQLILDVSNFIRFNIVWIIIGAILFSTLLIYSFHNKYSRPVMENIAVRIPLLGAVFQYSALTQFATTLSALHQSGLDMVNSMKVISPLMKFQIYKNVFDESVERILSGYSLKESLSSNLIPATMSNVVAVGEETGELGNVLNEVGKFYSMRLERVSMLLSSLVEPALIIFIGGMVAVVYIGLFQAILSLTGR